METPQPFPLPMESPTKGIANASETWEITAKTYKLLNIHVRQQEHGRKCSSENKVVPGSGMAHRYTMKDDTLGSHLIFHATKTPKNAGHGLCPGGTLVQTYQRKNKPHSFESVSFVSASFR